MTEDEAKTKWCPFARVAGQVGSEAQGTSFNRWTSGAAGGASDPAACIGSACMAWRVQQDVATETRRSSQRPAGDGWLPGEGYDDWTRTRAVVLGGYCGLAGAPQ